MAKGSSYGDGGSGGGLNALAGGAKGAPPGPVASGGGGPPPLPGAASPYGQQPGGGMYPGTYRGGGTNQGELEALYSGRPYGKLSGGEWVPPQITQKITPGGGNQNAFSPQAATVENVITPGRMAFANLMAGRGGGGGGGGAGGGGYKPLGNVNWGTLGNPAGWSLNPLDWASFSMPSASGGIGSNSGWGYNSQGMRSSATGAGGSHGTSAGGYSTSGRGW